jgi:hypothetical protein
MICPHCGKETTETEVKMAGMFDEEMQTLGVEVSEAVTLPSSEEMSLDADWTNASGTVWLIYVKRSDRRGIFPEGHIVSCQQAKPEGDPNFSGGILHSIEVAVEPGVWGRIVRGEMRVVDGKLTAEREPRRFASCTAQAVQRVEGV